MQGIGTARRGHVRCDDPRWKRRSWRGRRAARTAARSECARSIPAGRTTRSAARAARRLRASTRGAVSPPTRGGAGRDRRAPRPPAAPDARTMMSSANGLIACLLSRRRLRSALSRLYSSSDSGSASMSSSAAAADPGESSKNVRTSCFSAERLASSRRRRRGIDEARAVVLAAEQAAVDHDVEQLAHAGRARRVGQLGPDLFDGRASAAVEDFHDLRFAAREVRRIGSRHGRLRVRAKKFAHSEYIRAMARLSSASPLN